MGRGLRSELLIGLLVMVVFIVGAIVFDGPEPSTPIHSLRSLQEADTPAGFQRNVGAENPDGWIPEFDGQFVMLDAFERFALPPAMRLDQPLGSEFGALTYNFQPFMERNPDRGNSYHLGDDLNGIGGMDSDLGDPIHAVANGVVLYAGQPTPGWGNMVIVGHRLEGKLHHSLYAHLDEIKVGRGDLVFRGGLIGTVGNAGGSYPAHLHFELYDGVLIDPRGGGYSFSALNRLDPAGTIARHQRAGPEGLAPEPLAYVTGPAQVFQLGTGRAGAGPKE